ncbi:hypothetical protein [Nocardioides albidus]|uniref:hypothetical protein n=1 Tax=Nocardioides albidus TaxID=1517589 RepID=UPI0013052287|nr:hypothetical protein [Nocardioides albidus]
MNSYGVSTVGGLTALPATGFSHAGWIIFAACCLLTGILLLRYAMVEREPDA